jgi:subfamily B ATP-binding cassette protein MsbA
MRIASLLPAALRRALDDPDSDVGLVRRLLAETARTHVRAYLWAMLCMGGVAAATAASAWILRDVINDIFIERRGEMIAPIGFAVCAIFIVKGLATYGQSVIMARIGAGIVAQVQKRIARHVLGQSLAFYDGAVAGDLTTRVAHNAAAARDLINSLVTAAGRDALSVLALVGVMIVQDPGLALLALLVAPPAVIGTAWLMRRVKGLAKAEFLSQARIVSTMNQAVRGVRVVKAYRLEGRIGGELEDAIDDVEARSVGIARLRALSSPLMETLGGLAISAVILWAGWRVVALGGDPGSFFSFIAAFLLAYEPAKRLARLNVAMQARLVGVRLLYELLDTPNTLQEAPDARPLRLSGGAVRLEDVSFAYGSAPALRGLTLEAEAGRVTALVGPSGSGKSTVFNLIARFYDADEGAVTIDGQDVRGLTFESLRGALALVTQDSFLFDGTVRENVLAGRPDADDAALEQAARDANLDEFLPRLPGGWEAQVGEGGGRLSGGQRQRVAIARAMLRDAPILLLDEATSALDAESEAHVQEALGRLMQGRTTLVIAHRLSTIRNADRIVVLDGGRAVESGDHAALVAADGAYRRLHDLQFARREGA